MRAVKLYTTHEHWLVCPMHVLWKFDRAPCEKPECLRCVVHGRRPPQIWRATGLLRRASRHVDAFIAPSRFTAAMHAERGFWRPLEHLPHFLDRVDGDWERPGPRPQERPYFLFVGRLERIKGLQTVIPLWAQVTEADLLIAGTGNYEEQLRAMAHSNPRIKFLGALPQGGLGALYHHAIASIVPSLTYETFCMISLEAFARRTPVVARDIGPLPEVIDESGGGLLFRNDGELLDAVRRLASDTQLRGELGNRGYDAFIAKWTREAHLEQYFDLITRIAIRKFGERPWSIPSGSEAAIMEEVVT
jgi:glycosyltransferase involved in cell wall biosynthesis